MWYFSCTVHVFGLAALVPRPQLFNCMGTRLWFSYVEQSILMEYQLEYYYFQVQGEIGARTVAVINSSFEFIFEDNESVATLWPG